jgi:hypothetical protein
MKMALATWVGFKRKNIFKPRNAFSRRVDFGHSPPPQFPNANYLPIGKIRTRAQRAIRKVGWSLYGPCNRAPQKSINDTQTSQPRATP